MAIPYSGRGGQLPAAWFFFNNFAAHFIKLAHMVFDLELIRKIYSELPEKVAAARQLLGRPLTLSEKILYSHTYQAAVHNYDRGKDYVDFAPDRVAMQDATAQMALLQFMTCGRRQGGGSLHRALRSPDTGQNRRRSRTWPRQRM